MVRNMMCCRKDRTAKLGCFAIFLVKISNDYHWKNSASLFVSARPRAHPAQARRNSVVGEIVSVLLDPFFPPEDDDDYLVLVGHDDSAVSPSINPNAFSASSNKVDPMANILCPPSRCQRIPRNILPINISHLIQPRQSCSHPHRWTRLRRSRHLRWTLLLLSSRQNR